MPQEPELASSSQSSACNPADFDVSEQDIDEAIAACEGSARAAIRALLVAYAMLERDMSLRASAGFVRRAGRARRPAG
ncbi:hypothetical protein [Roseixanthobacter pseudopolyaromaticivorans]|uniref:hypothetical protein n=1 Tax=Xanthobacteraceae TaxID=335928 RepID=UPI0037277D68